MKMQAIQRKLVIEGGIAVTAVAVFLGIFMGVSAWSKGAVSGKTEVEGRSGQQQGEINTLRSKIDNADSSQKTYAKIVEKRGNDNFVVDNDKVRETLESLIARHRVSIEGKFEYSPEEKLALPELANLTTGFTIRRDATLKFEAISDIHVYSFLNALANKLPGVVNFKSLIVKREKPLNSVALSQLSLGKEAYLVQASVIFDWYAVVPAAGGASASPAPVVPAEAPLP